MAITAASIGSAFDELFINEDIDQTKKFRYSNNPRPGWGHTAVTPFHINDSNRVEYQGKPSFPITYYEWYDVSEWNRANFFSY